MTREHWFLCGIVLVALCVRIGVVLNLPAEEGIPKSDGAQYHMLAVSVLEGHGYAWPKNGPGGLHLSYYPLPEGPTSTRAPLYTAFLMGMYRVFGMNNFTAVQIAQCVLGAWLCAILYGIGRLWGLPGVGLLAAGLAAVYPPFLHVSYYGGPGRLLSEGLFMFLLAAGVWCVLRLAQNLRRWPSAVVGGVLLGLAALTRPIVLGLPGVLVVWACCAPRAQRWQWLRAVAIVCFAFGVTLVPWTVRNYQVHHRFVPVTTVAGQAFWVGNNPWARGGPVDQHYLYQPEEFDGGQNLSEVERFEKMRQEGLRFWRNYPGRLPKLFLRKVLMLWNIYELRFNIGYAAILPWAMLGMFVTWRRPRPQVHRLLIGLLAYVSLAGMIVMGSTRYRYPFEPYLVLFAAAGLVWFFQRSGSKWVPTSTLMGMTVVNLVVYRYSDQVLQLLRGAFQTIGLR